MRPYNFDGYWIDLDHIVFVGPKYTDYPFGPWRVNIKFMFTDGVISFYCPNRATTEEEADAERDKLIAAWRGDGEA